MDPLSHHMALCQGALGDPAATGQPRPPLITARPDDVIITGHVKSGTTWMQQIIHQLRTGGDENFDDIYNVVPLLPPNFIKPCRNLDIDQVAVPRVFKTHCLYEAIPKVDGATRFVVTVRDPHDAQLSFVKFMWRYLGYDKDMDSEEYMKTATALPEDFASFIAEWWPRRHYPNVLFMPYEDMKRDLSACVQKTSRFLFGHTLGEANLAKILHLGSFDYMSKHPEKFSGRDMMKFYHNESNLEQQVQLTTMVRPSGGRIGQGNAELDETIRAYVEKRWKETVEKEHGFKSYRDLYAEWRRESDAE